MSVTCISPVDVCKIQHNTYRSHTTHLYLFYRIGHVRLQGRIKRDTTIIYKSYDKYMAYTLALLASKEDLDIQTMSMN